MKVSDERAREMRETNACLQPSSWQDDLLDDREELLRYKAGFEESEKMLGWTNRRIEKLERVDRAARRVCIAQHMDPTGVPAAIYELSKTIDAAVEALDGEEV